MTPLVAAAVLLGLFLLLVLLRVPIGLALMLPAIPVALIMGFNPLEIVYQFKLPLEHSALLAIFTFVALGVFMEKAGVAERLVGFVDALIGHISGGLGITVVGASTFYGALTGSVSGTVAAIGSITIPGMAERGYPKPFAAAVVASSGILGSLIPPSIAAIIFGVLTDTSIIALFMCLLGPGLLYAFLLSLAVYMVSKRNGYRGHEGRLNIAEVGRRTVRVLPAMLIPLSVLGGIYLGVCSTTEAGILGTGLTVIVGFAFYRMKAKTLIPSVLDTFIVTAMVMFIICGSFAVSYIAAYTGLFRATADIIVSLSPNLAVMLLLVNVLLIIMGMFLEGAAIMVLLAPTIFTMLTTAGMNPLHIAAIFIFNGMVGFLTPPIGSALFVASGVSGVKVESIVRSIVPELFLAGVVTLILVVAVPAIALAIPNAMGL